MAHDEFRQRHVAAIGAAFIVSVLAGRAYSQAAIRVSVDSAGVEGNDHSGTNSYTAAVSSDGRVIAFESLAANLIVGDNNKTWDVFVHDRTTGITERVSVDSIGTEANGQSIAPSISSDGRFVAFWSDASNLVSADTNGTTDVFVHDRTTGTTIRASVDSSGFEANGTSYGVISPDGQYVAFSSDAANLVPFDFNSANDVFIKELSSGIVERLSVDSSGVEGNQGSWWPVVSADSNVVAFHSFASNLVSGDTNNTADVFIRDRGAQTTERASVDSSGAEANSHSEFSTLSSDGQLIAFESFASNLVTGDTNGGLDVFVHDRATGVTERASVDSLGNEGNGVSENPRISEDGTTVSFQSGASNLVAGDTNGWGDVFVHDLVTQSTARVSLSSLGGEGNQNSMNGAISNDGQVVVFFGLASNLVIADNNGKSDIFVSDQLLEAASATAYGSGLAGTLGVPQLTTRSAPVLGTQLTLDLTDSLGSDTLGLLFLGFQSGSIHTNFGSNVLVIPFIATLVGIPANGLALSGLLPNDPGLDGVHIDLQAVEGDGGAIRGVSFTAGLDLKLGY